MDNLLENIDNIKQKITDQEYRDLMDNLKELNDNKKPLYEFTLVTTEPLHVVNIMNNETKYNMRFMTIRPIIKESQFSSLIESNWLPQIAKFGRIKEIINCHYNTADNIITVGDDVESRIYITGHDIDDDYDEHNNYKSVEIQKYGIINIKKI